jgi:hypothetical protein
MHGSDVISAARRPSINEKSLTGRSNMKAAHTGCKDHDMGKLRSLEHYIVKPKLKKLS